MGTADRDETIRQLQDAVSDLLDGESHQQRRSSQLCDMCGSRWPWPDTEARLQLEQHKETKVSEIVHECYWPYRLIDHPGLERISGDGFVFVRCCSDRCDWFAWRGES